MDIDLATFAAQDSIVERTGASRWPVTLTSTGSFSLVHTDEGSVVGYLLASRYLVIDAEDLMSTNVTLALYFWRAGSDLSRPDMTITLGLFPGLPTRLTFDRNRLDGQQLFLDRTPGKLKSMARGSGITPKEVARFGLGIVRSDPGAKVRLEGLWSQAEEPNYPLPDVKIVDKLGQWKTHEWNAKTEGVRELKTYLVGAAASAQAASGRDPAVSAWGGMRATGLSTAAHGRLEATGFFRVHHDGRRYFLVDPDGYPFYSIGLDCVSEKVEGRVDGIEKLFEFLPRKDGELGEFWVQGSPRFPSSVSFDFLGANLRQSLGPDWFDKWAALTQRRMRDWGFNTIGNWSSERFINSSGLPYVVQLPGSISTSTPIFRDFPDVFSDEYARAAERHAAPLGACRGDSRLLGYFIMNEPHWGFENGLNVAEKLLANPAPLASKDALIAFLSDRYGGDVRRLADAWKIPELSSFGRLEAPVGRSVHRSDAAAKDLDDFNTVLIKRFAQLPCEAAKRADPDHLNLGMRYAWISQPALYETGEYFDVFSINRYAPTARDAVDEIGNRSGKPVLVGEFHHGGLDVGLPSNGIRGVRTQAERAEAYRHYVETTAASAWSVGLHYFTLNDQAVLGRVDGENAQIGLVDICQRPYAEFVAGVRDTNRGLPDILYGHRQPTKYYPKEVTVGF